MSTTLTIRIVPLELHARLKRRAKAHRHSLNSEIVCLLEAAVESADCNHDQILEQIDELRENGSVITDEPAELKVQAREGLA